MPTSMVRRINSLYKPSRFGYKGYTKYPIKEYRINHKEIKINQTEGNKILNGPTFLGFNDRLREKNT